jgi:hypothetical protein
METSEFEKLAQPIALVVDDEPLILMDTADMISAKVDSVVEASTADQAYAFLDKPSSLQLLVTDVQMPGDMTGSALPVLSRALAAFLCRDRLRRGGTRSWRPAGQCQVHQQAAYGGPGPRRFEVAGLSR